MILITHLSIGLAIMEYIHHLHTWEHLLKPRVLSPLRRNGVELVPLACEDDTGIECLLKLNISGHTTHSLKTALMHILWVPVFICWEWKTWTVIHHEFLYYARKISTPTYMILLRTFWIDMSK